MLLKYILINTIIGCRQKIFIMDGNAKLDVRVCIEPECWNSPARNGTVCAQHYDQEEGLDYYANNSAALFTGGCYFIMCSCGAYFDAALHKGLYYCLII